jgi:hypothetical protein
MQKKGMKSWSWTTVLKSQFVGLLPASKKKEESDCGQGDTGSDSTEEGSESFGSDIEVQIAKIHLVT